MPAVFTAVRDKECRIVILSGQKVFLKEIFGSISEINKSLLFAFAADKDLAGVVDLVAIKRKELRDAHTSGKKHFEHQSVAQTNSAIFFHSLRKFYKFDQQFKFRYPRMRTGHF